MNCYCERFVGSTRREAFDNFILLNKEQIWNIVSLYIKYYNSKRPHQGIEQNIPKGYKPQTTGRIISHPILSGLHHHYTRLSA